MATMIGSDVSDGWKYNPLHDEITLGFCKPHSERTGDQVPAVRIVFGTPMCFNCFSGKPIRIEEEKILLTKKER